ncbi:MAG: ABC transporter permease [Alphaproteobacteria bacterium]|nr:ABC transporter permease [Alphaproteobacteria bacterium]
MRPLIAIWKLGIKEIYSLLHDPVLMVLILYSFTAAVYVVTKGVKTEIEDAAIAIVDEDGSALSRQIASAFREPYFKPAIAISFAQVDEQMDTGNFSFVLVIPSEFEHDLLLNREPALQLNVDATAMATAGNGAGYIQQIIDAEIGKYLARTEADQPPAITLVTRAFFNPNMDSTWFQAVFQIINNITILALILSGAAVIREREHGTIEHLLVMPVRSHEIIIAKIWSNGLVIVASALLSLVFVVGGLLEVPLQGSLLLFACGAALYLFAITSLGIMISTIATTMPQFSLLSIPIFVVLNLLSGGVTPLESMPEFLQYVMQISPTTHFVKFSQGVLYRGAGIDIVWRYMLFTGLIGFACFTFALARYRATMSAAR